MARRLSCPRPARRSISMRSRLACWPGFRLLVAVAVLAIVGATALSTGLGARRVAAQEVPVTQSRYFAETGHNLAEPFLSRWQAAGGEAVLGLPLSEERYAEGAGGILQTFATLTLIYDPTLEPPYDVQGQPLSQEERDAQAPRPARAKVAGCSGRGADCQYFPETGHTLSGRLADFWTSVGGETLFGLPVSEPFADSESDASAQVFERAVLEDHGVDGVLLRPVGELQAETDGLLTDPAFQPAPPTGGTTTLVNASDGLRLRAAPSLDAEMVALLPNNAEFIAAPGDYGDWVPGYVDGYAGWVSAEYLRQAPPLPTISTAEWDPKVWQGAALGETNVRAQPSTKARVVEELEYGDPLKVTAWVEGEEVFEGADLWAQIGPNRFVYGRNVGRTGSVAPPPLPADAPSAGNWIDVNLTQQIMVAYEGRTPVRVTETTTGMAGWETPPGFYHILWRVANETMTSGAIGAEHFYELKDVLFTQYFTERGHAIHFAWWRTNETIGRPGSHGCLNLLLDDARFFWDWANVGTPVYVHR